MKVQVALALVSAALFMTACASKQPVVAADTHDADVKAISDADAQLGQAIAAKDANKIASFFTDDAVLAGYATPPMTGNNTIATWFVKQQANPGSGIKTQGSKTDVSKDLGYGWGTYELVITGTDAPYPKHELDDHGSYITIWKRQSDGSWKVVQALGSSAVDHGSEVAKILMAKHGGAK